MDAKHDLECWRCGAENKTFALPSHPDGGGTICHECHTRIYGPPTAKDLIEAVGELMDILPSCLSCDDFHHEFADRHSGVEVCGMKIKYEFLCDKVRDILSRLTPEQTT